MFNWNSLLLFFSSFHYIIIEIIIEPAVQHYYFQN